MKILSSHQLYITNNLILCTCWWYMKNKVHHPWNLLLWSSCLCPLKIHNVVLLGDGALGSIILFFSTARWGRLCYSFSGWGTGQGHWPGSGNPGKPGFKLRLTSDSEVSVLQTNVSLEMTPSHVPLFSLYFSSILHQLAPFFPSTLKIAY